MTGSIIGGRYHLDKQIGQGGMGEVWLARDEGPEGYTKTVVIKRMLPEAARFTDYFRAEARLVAALPHQNIAQVINFFKDEHDQYNIVMEYVEGADLFDLIFCERARLTIDMCVYIAAEALKGIDFAHRAKIDGVPAQLIHRDISPHNILVSYAAEIKITDFGVARATLEWREKTEGPQFRGKFAYAAPEALREKLDIDSRVDVYSMGVVLWEMLARRRAFSGSVLQVLTDAAEAKVPDLLTLNSAVSPALAAIVRKMMHADKAKRFQTAAEARNALVQCLPTWANAWEPLKAFVQIVRPKDPASVHRTQIDMGGIVIDRSPTAPTKDGKRGGEDHEAIPTFTGSFAEDSAPSAIISDLETLVPMADDIVIGAAQTTPLTPVNVGALRAIAGPNDPTMARVDSGLASAPTMVPPPNDTLLQPPQVKTIAPLPRDGRVTALIDPEQEPTNRMQGPALDALVEKSKPARTRTPLWYVMLLVVLFAISAGIGLWLLPSKPGEDKKFYADPVTNIPPAPPVVVPPAPPIVVAPSAPAHVEPTPIPPAIEAHPRHIAPIADVAESKPKKIDSKKPAKVAPSLFPLVDTMEPIGKAHESVTNPGKSGAIKAPASKSANTGHVIFVYKNDEKVSVEIDDAPIGVRPQSFELAPGQHTVRLLYPSGRKVMSRETINVGGSTRVDVLPSQ